MLQFFKDDESQFAEMTSQIRSDVIMSYPVMGIEKTVPNFKFRTAVDLGSNIGFWSIEASRVFNKVHSFEAVNFLDTVARHQAYAVMGRENIFFHNLAASNKSGDIVKIYKSKNEHIGDSSIILTEDSSSEYEHTMTICLEDIYKLIDVDYIDYLKVDIEGSEYDLLMNKDLSNIGILAMEVHELPNDKNARENLFNHLSNYFVAWKPPINGAVHNIVCINKTEELRGPGPLKYDMDTKQLIPMDRVF